MIQSGFDFDEAKAMLALSQAIYGVPAIPVSTPDPAALGWSKVDILSPSRATLLDNLWQVWRDEANPNRHAIVVRGTVDTTPSILADLLFPLVDARLDLKIPAGGQEIDIPFHLARDEAGSAVVAGTHLGFTLGLLLMLLTTDRPLLLTLMALSANPDAEIFITGHSQGASLATLLTSFVRHASGPFASISKAAAKTYVFAPAKPGNDHYGNDYAAIAGVRGLAWTVLSTQGWVPQVPFTLQIPSDLNTPNPLRAYEGTPPATLDPRLATLQAALEPMSVALRKQSELQARALTDTLKAQLAAETRPVGAVPVPTGETAAVDGAALSHLVDSALSHLQLSLNYTDAGARVPLFATPGGNPDDPSDFFWQHHLGNYWTYMQAQYGAT